MKLRIGSHRQQVHLTCLLRNGLEVKMTPQFQELLRKERSKKLGKFVSTPFGVAMIGLVGVGGLLLAYDDYRKRRPKFKSDAEYFADKLQFSRRFVKRVCKLLEDRKLRKEGWSVTKIHRALEQKRAA